MTSLKFLSVVPLDASDPKQVEAAEACNAEMRVTLELRRRETELLNRNALRWRRGPGGLEGLGPFRVDYVRGMKRVYASAGNVWVKTDKRFAPTELVVSLCKEHPDVVELWVDLPLDGHWGWNPSSMPGRVFNDIDTSKPTTMRMELARAAVKWVHSFLEKEKQ